MKNTERLFVYGLLKPGYYEPKVLQAAEPAVISGRCYDLNGKDAATIDVGGAWGKVEGFVLTISEKTLIKIDEMESPQFERISTQTWDGSTVWVYQYKNQIPKGSKLVENWHEHNRKRSK